MVGGGEVIMGELIMGGEIKRRDYEWGDYG